MERSADELIRMDQQHLWHPFTQMQDWLNENPVIIERGEGNYLFDTHGNKYLDGVSSLWCNVHGHQHPHLDAALIAQSQKVAHSTLLGLTCKPSIELAEKLVAVAPDGMTRVFYSDAGATAVEIALKMAFQYWSLKRNKKKTQFASLTEAYHGDTIGAISLGYSKTFHSHFDPLLFPCLKLNPPHLYRRQQGMSDVESLAAAISEAEDLIENNADELAALIIEPLMQGAAGMWSQPLGYARALRELCTKHDVLFICDEVATGFGRTGKMFAVEHEQVRPDILCVGKGISGGYLPLAATLTTEEIFSAFLGPYDEFKSFFHGHTYTGNALACAVALANLEVFEDEKVIDHVQECSEEFSGLLEEHIGGLKHVADIRKWGLMVGIEILQDVAAERPFAVSEKIPHKIILAARHRGVIIRPLGNVIILMPPLSIQPEELVTLCRITGHAIAEGHRELLKK